MWLYTCRMAGLSIQDLRHMRIDTAEALIELHEFVQEAIYDSEGGEKSQSAEDAFWAL